MAPNNNSDILQGLNLVRPTPASAAISSDAQDLLAGPSYADIAQLDLWTNVAFASDEPFVPGDVNSDDGDEKDRESSGGTASDHVKKKRDMLAKRNFDRSPLTLPSTMQPQQQQQHSAQPQSVPVFQSGQGQAYDIPSLLAMTGNQFAPDMMNLNQLLYANPFQSGFQFASPFTLPLPPAAPTPLQQSSSSTAPLSQSTVPPPAKKARSRKASSATQSSRLSKSSSPNPAVSSPSAELSPGTKQPIDTEADDQDEDGAARPLGSSEDKRRRNTAASARFRLKKKEREAAMEGRCKDLESKVGELERECEALRRENGWLKGLVVGVTGGTGVPMMPAGPSGASIAAASSSSSSSAPGSKRSAI